jgi:MoaA/NifB/PqqE/SkfB family radical SAM enzyme
VEAYLSRPLVQKRYSRFLRCWLMPYLHSRFRPGLRPIVGCVYTEWKCNLQCGYCRSHDNLAPGMDDATAGRVIDWLHATGCRVIGLMGGEPLLRPDFVARFVARASARGFHVSLPTNGRRLTPDVTDRLGDAGIGTINLSLDCVHEKPGLPKALQPIRGHFDHLVTSQARFGHTVLLSINITRYNLDDVEALTRVARDHGIGTAYHLCDSGGDGHFEPQDLELVDGLLDYLIDCHGAGFAMVNSVEHLRAMKRLLRGELPPWRCRAGRNMVVCRTDGSLAPCYPLVDSPHDWGAAGRPKLNSNQLTVLQQSCSPACFSTTAWSLAHYYDVGRICEAVAARASRRRRGPPLEEG